MPAINRSSRHFVHVLLAAALLAAAPIAPAPASASSPQSTLQSSLQSTAPTAPVRADFDWIVTLVSTRKAWNYFHSGGYKVAVVHRDVTSPDLALHLENINGETDGPVVFLTEEQVKALKTARAFTKNHPLHVVGHVEQVLRTGLCSNLQRRRGNCDMLTLTVDRVEPLTGRCAASTRSYRMGGRWGLDVQSTFAACAIRRKMYTFIDWATDVAADLRGPTTVQVGSSAPQLVTPDGNVVDLASGTCSVVLLHRFDAKDDGKEPFTQKLTLRQLC